MLPDRPITCRKCDEILPSYLMCMACGEDNSVPPRVEDSPAWNHSMRDWLIEPDPEPVAQVLTLEEAVAVIVTVGEKVRECPACSSRATDIDLLAYEKREGYTHAYVQESCNDCGNQTRYYLHATMWLCAEAMRCWEGVKTATALFRSEQQAQADLDALDVPPDPPA